MLPTLLAGAKLLQKQMPDVHFAMPRAGTIPMEMPGGKIKAAGLMYRLLKVIIMIYSVLLI